MTDENRNVGMLFNGGVQPETVSELRTAINDILQSDQDQVTLQLALKVLGSGAKAGPMYVSNCSVNPAAASDTEGK